MSWENKISLSNVGIDPRIEFPFKPLPSEHFPVLYLILSETVLLTLLVLPRVFWDYFAFLWVPYSGSSPRHETFFPCAFVFHRIGLMHTESFLKTVSIRAFVLGPILKLYRSLAVDLVVFEFAFVLEFLRYVGYEFTLSLFFPLLKLPFVS
jgi:hypothetical protein